MIHIDGHRGFIWHVLIQTVCPNFTLMFLVVWNPWADKAAGMADFGDNEYPSMICVEAGYVSEPYTLAAGQTYQASQVLSV